MCSQARFLFIYHWMTPSLKFKVTYTISLGWNPFPWLETGLLLSNSWPLQLYSITLSPSPQLCLSLWRASTMPTHTPGYSFWIIPILLILTVNSGIVRTEIEPIRIVGKIKSSYFQMHAPFTLKCFENLAVLSIKMDASSIAGSFIGFIMCLSSFKWDSFDPPSFNFYYRSNILACSACRVSYSLKSFCS